MNVVRERERRWLAVLSNWDGWASRKPLKVAEVSRMALVTNVVDVFLNLELPFPWLIHHVCLM